MKKIMILLFINVAYVPPVYLHTQSYPLQQSERWITVFIHGTVALRPNLNLGTFVRLLRDDIDQCCYSNIVDAIRNDSFFFHGQPMQTLGLHKIVNPEHTAACSTRLFAHLYDSLSPQPTRTEYYTFGWHGLVSHRRRYEEARNLYRELLKLRATLAKECPTTTIKIRLVGYSHGGSVALNLAAVQEKEFFDESLTIHELIMIGTPVQRETDYLISSDVFEKIYHFYSRNDHIQKLDCFSFKRFFSSRRFNERRKFTLPSKLKQVEIKLKHSKRRSLDHSPNHMELWFFGWSPRSIRPHFIIWPLPCAVLLPSIIAMLETHLPTTQHSVVTLYADNGTAYLRQRHYTKGIKVPWIETEKLSSLKEHIQACQPHYFTQEHYNAHIQNALKLAAPDNSMRPRKYARCMCGHEALAQG